MTEIEGRKEKPLAWINLSTLQAGGKKETRQSPAPTLPEKGGGEI